MAEPPRLPVSAFLIAKDEEARLPRTLAALGFVDEIVLVDSGSSDRTVALAEAAGARVLRRAFDGYGAQKSFAEAACRHDFVLNVDADEVVTPDLEAELRALFAAGPPPPGAWSLPILTVYPGDRRPRWLAADYRVVRFYHRGAGRYSRHPLFDRVELAPGHRAARLRGALHHFALTSFHQFVEKENRYTSFQAEAARSRRRSVLLARLPFEMPLQFAKFYLLRGHVTGGWKGFVFAAIAAFARMLRIAKLLERDTGERRK